MNITIGNQVISDIISANTSTFTTLLPLITLMLSVPLAFYVLRKIIFLFPRR